MDVFLLEKSLIVFPEDNIALDIAIWFPNKYDIIHIFYP